MFFWIYSSTAEEPITITGQLNIAVRGVAVYLDGLPSTPLPRDRLEVICSHLETKEEQRKRKSES